MEFVRNIRFWHSRRMAQDSSVTEALPLTEQAYLALRRALIRGDFEPGQRLRVDELQRRLGLSSSPLREALSRLVQQGLVRALEHRGFRVAPINADAVRDLTRVRLLVETETLRDAIAHGDDRWEGRVVAAHHSLALVEKRLPEGPVALDDDWSERHRALHMSIYSGCTSPLLLGLVENLFDQAERFRRFSARHRQTDRHKNDEHQRIVDAVLGRKTDVATELLRRHIMGTERSVLEGLQAMEEAPALISFTH